VKKIQTIEKAIVDEKKLRVCAYCRVSSDQVDQQNSLAAQVEHYTNLIKNNSAWNFAGIYVDDVRPE